MAAAAPQQLPKLTEQQAIDIANACRAAMKGIGTDEKALLEAICPLNHVQVHQVIKAYTDHVKRDLIKDVKSETGGNFEKVLLYALTSAAEIDAALVRTAYKGMGTDEAGLIEIICTRTDLELQEASKAFKKEYEAFMRDEVLGDCSGDFKKLMDTVLTAAEKGGRKLPPLSQVDDDVLRLYKAGEGKIGTNESVFIEIIGGNHRAYVEKVAEAYGKKYGKSLVSVIKSEMGGNLRDGLVALVQPVAENLAARLHAAMKGAGTDEKVMVRLIVGNRDFRLRKMNDYFLHRYEKSISHWVKGEVGGDIKKTLVAVCEAHQG